MQIYGPGPLHGPHSVGPAHAPRAPQATEVSRPGVPHDEVEISEMGQLLESLNSVPDVRHSRIEQIRSAIADGTYDTDDKMSKALERLLDEIG